MRRNAALGEQRDGESAGKVRGIFCGWKGARKRGGDETKDVFVEFVEFGSCRRGRVSKFGASAPCAATCRSLSTAMSRWRARHEHAIHSEKNSSTEFVMNKIV